MLAQVIENRMKGRHFVILSAAKNLGTHSIYIVVSQILHSACGSVQDDSPAFRKQALSTKMGLLWMLGKEICCTFAR